MFWPLSSGEIPTDAVYTQSPSSSGDKCHHDVFGLTNGQARKIAINIDPDDCFVCDGETGVRSCSVTDFEGYEVPANQ